MRQSETSLLQLKRMVVTLLIPALLVAVESDGGSPPPAQEQAAPQHSPLSAPLTVGLDLSGLDEPSFKRLDGAMVENEAVIRLVQEGFAVTSVANGPTL